MKTKKDIKEIEELLNLGLKEELSADDLKEMTKHGFAFGSSVFGDKQKAKDFDIAVYFNSSSFIHGLVEEKKLAYIGGYKSNEDFLCLYGKCRGVIVNVLDFHSEMMFKQYKKATEIMKYLYKNDDIKPRMNEKDFRVRLFEFFVDEL